MSFIIITDESVGKAGKALSRMNSNALNNAKALVRARAFRKYYIFEEDQDEVFDEEGNPTGEIVDVLRIVDNDFGVHNDKEKKEREKGNDKGARK
jgi:hypothetical protein